MAEFRHTLLSAFPLPAPPGEVRVLLSCSCGTDTGFTFPADAAGERGRSCACEGCGTSHWFKVRTAGNADDG